MNKIMIPLPLMTLNEYTTKQRTSIAVGNSAKKQCTRICRIHVLKAMREGFSIENLPVRLRFTWYCANRRQDPDNICFQRKFILDGMVNAKLLENDGWDQILGFVDDFEIDKTNSRVEIEII